MAKKSKDKSSRIWYARYPGDYARKTAHLSLTEDGAFSKLMDWYYSNEKPLPLEWVQMHRICKAIAPFEQDAVQAVVEQFFVKGDAGWYNSRADEEIEKKQRISEKRRAAQASREEKRKAKQGFISKQELEKIHAAGHADYGPGGKKDPAKQGAKDPANGGAFAPTTITTTKEGYKPPSPLNNSQAVDGGDESAGRPYDVEPHLTDRDRARFYAVAKQKDIGFYIREFNRGVSEGTIKNPRFPAKLFLSWVEGCIKNEVKNAAADFAA